MVPFLPLTELAAHEQHLFPGMAVHVSIEQPEIGKALPHITGHLVEQRSFAVDHFVMREGKDKILTEGVEQAKRDLILMEPPIDGVVLEER